MISEYIKQIADFANLLVKEEPSEVNPILPINDVSVKQGWQCPICGRVYSPTTSMCFYCSNKAVINQQTSK